MSPIKRFLLTLSLTAMWSPSFLFIKLAVQDLPPLTIAFFRVTLAAAILSAILAWNRRTIPMNGGFWLRMGIMALFSSVLPFALFCYAETSIDSALAAILNGSTPMFTAILAHLFVSSDRVDLHKATGISLGTGGLLILFLPKIFEGLSGTLIGMLAGMIAAFSYAISHVFAKNYTVGHKPYVAPTAQLILSSAMLCPFAFWHDDIIHLPMPSLSAMGGVCGLALFGTVLAFIFYYKLLEYCGPTAISMVACFFPVVGMFLGFFFLGEQFTVWGLAGSGLIVLGMLLVNEVVVLDFLKAKSASSVKT
jgi:drug/metabolite transporter (DMT)-like permease